MHSPQIARCKKLEVLTRLMRPPYRIMLEVSCILFMTTFQRGIPSVYSIGLVSLVLLFITSGRFAINYFDRGSDAIVHSGRPIPSNKISPLGVMQFSVAMFLAGFIVTLWINHFALGIAVFCIVF